jgi:hypothetical protein
VRILRDDSELRAALGRAEDTERRIAERMARRSGRYARLIDGLEDEGDSTHLHVVEKPGSESNRKAG